MAEGFSLVDAPEFHRVRTLLAHLDVVLFRQAECWFAGGTAISFRCGEFRISRDVDFLCSSRDGYRLLRQRVFDAGGSGFFAPALPLLREARVDRYGIRMVVLVEGEPIKFEVVSEGRIDLEGAQDPSLPVPRLSDVDLVTEKLLANADRYLDDGALGRDVIDLILLENTLGELPPEAWNKAVMAYGSVVEQAWNKALQRLKTRSPQRARWLDLLAVSPAARAVIEHRLSTVESPDDGSAG